MFLNIDPGVRRKAVSLKELPPIPYTGWVAPNMADLPDLRDAALISIDTETYEPDFDHGPGWGRGKGHIVGMSLAARSHGGHTWHGYFPIRHTVRPEDNLPAAQVIAWFKAMTETNIPKTGANLTYDVGWLGEEGINVGGDLYDTQFAEALLDEQGYTNLDYLAYKYLKKSKTKYHLYEWARKAYGGGTDQRGNIYRSPPALVGDYGADDAFLPLDILPLQWEQLYREGQIELYKMECRLTRLLIKMRRQGVLIDTNYAEKLYTDLGALEAKLLAEFTHTYGFEINVDANATLTPVFDYLGIKYPRTPPSNSHPNGQASFVKDWLHNLDHPVGKQINRIRELRKLRGTFVKSYLLESNVNGVLHCNFHALRADKTSGKGTNGAKTGRLASSAPNLQNIPVRTEEGKMIRRAFISRSGKWGKWDYSQIEYRFLAHFAVDDGDGSAQLLRDNYVNDPDCDYHDIVYFRACPFMGWNPEDAELKKNKRRPIKNTNFGLLYGQGQGKLSRTMGFSPEQSRQFFEAYHSAAPYVKPTMKMCANEVHNNGFVSTILGRRTRFDKWGPFSWNNDEEVIPLPYDMALSKWGSNIERAFSYRAVNYKFQGSAADMMKRAMDLCDQSGVFDAIGVPLLTVHDELDFDVWDDTPYRREAYAYMQHTMEGAIQLRVPVTADPAYGPNWGDVKE